MSVEVRNAVQTILASKDILPYHEKTRLLQFASFTFDMSIFDCFIAWTFGLTLCTADYKLLLSDLERVINELKVTFLDLTPSVASSIRRCNLPSVETLYCIGEELSPNTIIEWNEMCLNSYGPTGKIELSFVSSPNDVFRSRNVLHNFQDLTANEKFYNWITIFICYLLCPKS